MGLAPNAIGENPGRTALAKVPVPIFSQPPCVAPSRRFRRGSRAGCSDQSSSDCWWRSGNLNSGGGEWRGPGRIPTELWVLAAEAEEERGIEETACQLQVNAERLEEWGDELGLVQEPKESVATEFVELSPMPWGCVRRMPGRGGRIRRAGSSASRSRAGRWPSWLACCRRCAAERRHRDPVRCGFSCDVALHSRGWTRGR